MYIKRTIAAAIALACICLAGCGENDDNNSAPAAGGAVTKTEAQTEAHAETEIPDETEAPAETEKKTETEAADDSEAELSQVYEGSFTQKFAQTLAERDFSIELSYYLTDGDEGMGLQRSDSYDVKGDSAHYRSVDADGKVTEHYYIPEGLYTVNEDGSVSPMNTSQNGMTGTEDMAFTVMAVSGSAELISADSYSDGTVEEILNTDGIERTLIFDGDTGALISMEVGNEYMTVNSFREGIDEVKLPEGAGEIVP